MSIVINDNTRLFLNDSGQCNVSICDKFTLVGCIGLGDLTQSKERQDNIKCPNPLKYDSFISHVVFTPELQDGSSTVERYLDDNKQSILKRLFDTNCISDMQIHIGKCGVASQFNNFQKAMLLYDVEVTDRTVSKPMIIESSEREAVKESSAIVYRKMVEVLQPNLVSVQNAQISAGPIVGVNTYADYECCLCIGSETQYFTQFRYTSVPNPPEPDVTFGEIWIVYTPDGGKTWESIPYAACEVIDETQQTLNGYSGISSLPDNVISIVLGDFINQTGFLDAVELLNQGVMGTDRNLFDISGYIFDIANYQDVIFTVASNGYLAFRLGINGINNQIPLLTTSAIYSVDTLDGDLWIAGGEADAGSGIGVFFKGNTTGSPAESILVAANGVTISDITHVKYIDNDTYIATTINGINLRTCSGGHRWAIMEGLTGCVSAITFFDKFIGYAVANNTNGVQLFQTIDGGVTWNHIGDKNGPITYPLNYQLNWIDVSKSDPNVVSAGGRVMAAPLTPEELCDKSLLWDYVDDTGIVIMSNVR